MKTVGVDKKQVADALNFFVQNVPFLPPVTEDDLTMHEDGSVRVDKKISDVTVSVTVGAQSLSHAIMAAGFVSSFRRDR